MTLQYTDTTITSDVTHHTASLLIPEAEVWSVSTTGWADRTRYCSGARPRCTLQVDLGAVYSVPDILYCSPQVLVRFITDSAIPTIYPFVRELIADVSSRIGVEYVIASLEPPRVSDAILNSLADDVARAQQETIAETRSATSG